MRTMKEKIECDACDGTGLYSGFAEPKGIAVVCNKCDGKGHGSGRRSFQGRKRKKGIHTVWIDYGLWMMRTGKANEQPSITADEFYSK